MSGAIETITTLTARGGPIMIPLFGLSFVAITLATERALFWLSLSRVFSNRDVDTAAQALRHADPAALAKATPPQDSLPQRIISSIHSAEPHEALAVETAERFRPRIERFSTTLSTIITAAPLLGILGTVLGIIDAFDLVGSAQGAASVTDVASGIAQALITTAFGLIVALVTLFPYMVFRSLADRMLGSIELLVAAHTAGAASRARNASSDSPAARALERSLGAPANP